MKILITGGAGFIGSNFVRLIARQQLQGYSKVIVLDKLTYAGLPSNLSEASRIADYTFVKGDINDYDLVNSLVAQVDFVVNFAAESHVDRSIVDSKEFVRTNVLGVQTILDSIKDQKHNVRMLQVSTDEVYGSISQGSWDEESLISPNSPYSASKAAGELLALAHHRTFGTDVVVTRSSNNYGTHHFPEKLIPLFITNLLEGKKVPVYGNGKNIRDWLHVDDHCKGIHLALTKGDSGNSYNIGGGRELSNLEITKQILNLMGRDESSIQFVEDRKGHDFRYSINWSKIRTSLNYFPSVSFEDGLKDTVDWYINNAEWWKPLKMGSRR